MDNVVTGSWFIFHQRSLVSPFDLSFFYHWTVGQSARAIVFAAKVLVLFPWKRQRVLDTHTDRLLHIDVTQRKYSSYENTVILKISLLIKWVIVPFLTAGNCSSFLVSVHHATLNWTMTSSAWTTWNNIYTGVLQQAFRYEQRQKANFSPIPKIHNPLQWKLPFCTEVCHILLFIGNKLNGLDARVALIEVLHREFQALLQAWNSVRTK